MSDGVRLVAPPIDEALLARIEDAGINASAPREQRWVDGWIVRLSPGKAKRARCVQAVAAGRLDVRGKLDRCLPMFARAGLPPLVRVTPFSLPRGLDAELAALGMARVDDTLVMVVPSLAAFALDGDSRSLVANADPETFAEWVGSARGSSLIERRAHADRLRQPAVPHQAVLARNASGEVVAGGQVAVEEEVAGLYDVFTREAARRRGHAERVCRHLLAAAARRGASVGYLQVEASNETAISIYRRLGFVDGYRYHYRTLSTEPGAAPVRND